MQLYLQLVLVKTNIGGLFFDAVLNVSTEHPMTITSHPVQSGANLSDHAFREPVKISMEVAVSDAMDSMVPGQYVGGYTKSTSAYRTLIALQATRTPLRVLTRLNRYDNMLIQSISVNDDVKTLYGLRATVQLQEVMMATVATEKVSARNWTSGGANKKGAIQPQETPTSVGAVILKDGGNWNPQKGGKTP